jgi:D-alanyl-D-alanine carboxypeptidase
MQFGARYGRRCVGWLTGSAVLACGLVAQPAAAAIRPGALRSALVSARDDAGAPAAQAAIATCGRVVWAGGVGVIALGSGRRVSKTTRFVIASTTKMFTATMIMQQVQAGRLSLDAPLARFYPQLPNATKITVRMLLRNRSGLGDYESVPAIETLLENSRHRWTRAEILKHITQTLFAPNARYRYTNTNWIVLGGILEKVTGMPIETYFTQNIAAKAGMRLSTWTRTPALIRALAHNYSEKNGQLEPEWVNGFGPATNVLGPVFTDGGLVSTAGDLARFGNAWLEGRLVSPATVALMTDVRGNQNYGLGTLRKTFDRRAWFGHDGSYGGYESENWTDPIRRATVTVTATGDGVAGEIWDAVAKAYDRQAPRSPTACGS